MAVKKRVVKRKSRTKGSAGNSVLSGAIKDLESELLRLNREKSEVKKQISDTSSMIDVDREKENELQKKIVALLEKEAQLNQKKKSLQTKSDKITDKVSKISRIKTEMSDI